MSTPAKQSPIRFTGDSGPESPTLASTQLARSRAPAASARLNSLPPIPTRILGNSPADTRPERRAEPRPTDNRFLGLRPADAERMRGSPRPDARGGNGPRARGFRRPPR